MSTPPSQRPTLRRAALLGLTAITLASAGAPATEPDTAFSWRTVGPADAGAPVALEIDPRQPEQLYLGTADGVFVSRNGGGDWRLTPLPGLAALALHPGRRQRLYAVSRTVPSRFRLWRSDDRAGTWTPLGEVDAPAGPRPSVTVHALALHPENPDVLVVAGAAGGGGEDGDPTGRLWRSADGGATLAAAQAPRGLPPAALLVTRDGALLAGTARGIFRSTDRGTTWRPAHHGMDEEDAPPSVLHLAASAHEPELLYAGTADGRLLRSDDGGSLWTAVDAALPQAAVTGLAVDPRDRRSLWASFDGHGLHATRGGAWVALEPELPEDAAPRHLALAPGSPTRLYSATADGALYRRVPPSPECVDGADTLCLGGRFRVEVDWWRPGAGTADAGGRGRAVPLAGEAGWFWFSEPEAPQLAVKLRPDPEGGAARLHVASLSDAGFDLRIFDVDGGRFETWRQEPGDHGAATGVSRFAAGRASTGAPLWFAPLPDGGCGGEEIDLCLWDGRFRVQVDWRTADGDEGAAVADRLSRRAGWFRFRHPDDPELFIDLADGRRENGHWWLSYASLGDAGFDLTVVDAESGESVTYSVPAGQPVSHRDTRALAAGD